MIGETMFCDPCWNAELGDEHGCADLRYCACGWPHTNDTQTDVESDPANIEAIKRSIEDVEAGRTVPRLLETGAWDRYVTKQLANPKFRSRYWETLSEIVREDFDRKAEEASDAFDEWYGDKQ